MSDVDEPRSANTEPDSSAPLVTVVVPVYNVEAYLEQCLNSLRSQTLQDLAVVCVNDGSTDGSRSIVARFVQEDSRFSVVDQVNGGLSAARNAGVREATGTYLLFLDSDDYLAPEALSSLTQIAVRNDVDVLFFDANSFFETEDLAGEHGSYETYYVRSADYTRPRSGPELFTEMLKADDYRPSACLQLISRRHYQDSNLDFVEGLIHEDNLFTFECLLTARRAAHTAQALYERRVRAGSITTQAQPRAEYFSALTTYVEMMRFVSAHDWPLSARSSIASYVNRTLGRAVRHSLDLMDDEVASASDGDAPVDVHVAVGAVLMQRREILRRRMAQESTAGKIRRKLKSTLT